MKRVAFALLPLACATVTPPPPAPVPAAASFVIPKVTHWEMPLRALDKLLVRPDGAVLAVAAEDEQALRIVAIDPATLKVTRRTEPFAQAEVFADWTLSANALYVLFDVPDDDEHLLVAIDPMTFDERGRSERKGTIHAVVDHAFPPHVELGKRGVHVRYRVFDAKSGDRYVDEVHAESNVARMLVSSGAEDDALADPPAGRWTFDASHHRITSADGRTVDCPVHGERLGQPVWSGTRMFIATEGCCGGDPGGFFVCEAGE